MIPTCLTCGLEMGELEDGSFVCRTAGCSQYVGNKRRKRREDVSSCEGEREINLLTIKGLANQSVFLEWLDKPHNFPIRMFKYDNAATTFTFIGYAGVYCVSRDMTNVETQGVRKIRKYFMSPKSALEYLNDLGLLWDFLNHYMKV